MRKVLMFLSIIASSIGMKSMASTIDKENNLVVQGLLKSGLNIEEIKQLDLLSKLDSDQFKKAVDQDIRIKGALKFEVLATANKGGGPCIQGGRD
ncbi:MAG: hypothetical protein ACXWRE_01080 [Pseudobdellovibrionaceae bacterium]